MKRTKAWGVPWFAAALPRDVASAQDACRDLPRFGRLSSSSKPLTLFYLRSFVAPSSSSFSRVARRMHREEASDSGRESTDNNKNGSHATGEVA
jgi:hypothetical protein